MARIVKAWIDLETTGLIGLGPEGPEGAAYRVFPSPLELGLVLTDGDLNELGRRSMFTLTLPWRDAEPADVWGACDPFALAMHEESGLKAEWEANVIGWAKGRALYDIVGVDQWLGALLRETMAMIEAEAIQLCGSGIGPFDVPLLRRWFPQTMALVQPRGPIRYRPFDVATLRDAGAEVGVISPHSEEDRPHRALPDAEWSLDEARWWRKWMADSVRARSVPYRWSGLGHAAEHAAR